MKKIDFNFSLSLAIGAVLTLSGVTTVSAQDLVLSEIQPVEISGLPIKTGASYIVRLSAPPIATYEGGISGYAATSARANGQKRLNTRSISARRYEKYLRSQQRSVLEKAGQRFGRQMETKFNYQHAVNGFTVIMSAAEAKAMGNMAEVISVQPERMEHVLTDSGPAWIGAPELWDNKMGTFQGGGMVVAILDTGINSDHPSFADVGDDGYDHHNPLGSGNYLPGSYCDVVDPGFCNDKLIGAWSFVTEAVTPEDSDGHGSHTASTAVGNYVDGATLFAPTTSVAFDISGVAPHANVIAYDVCVDGCPGGALVAAVNQVLIDAGNLPDGIAALNFSISGGGDPYNDAVEMGFLSAVEAGIYVAASAGNSGPTASTVAHLGPWVSTTAASTHNRQVRNALVGLTGGDGGIFDIPGLGLTSGYGPAPIINSADLESAFPGSTLCGLGASGDFTPPWPPGTFSGEIVACTRGTFGRVEKGANVLAAGAGGYVLMDNGGGLVGDSHVLPGVHISAADGAILAAWLAANAGSGPMASIAGFSLNLDFANGDVMAGFSSRGPQLAFDVLKPDVTAPGVDIMGAEANGDAPPPDEYQIISGTSMSSPHNTGAGALMTEAHPDWTPQEIKSAIMLTATTKNLVKENGVTHADPFDLGAGRIELGDAVDSELVMSESIADFLAANPDSGGDPSSLNLASMMNSHCVESCSWTRTVSNTEEKTVKYDLSLSGFADAEIKVKAFGKKSKKGKNEVGMEIRKHKSADITVTITTTAMPVGWHFGTLKLKAREKKAPDLHMPVAVFVSRASDPTAFTKTVDAASATKGDTLTYELTVTNGQMAGPITVTDVVRKGSKFVSSSETESVINGATSSAWTYDSPSKTLSWTGELDPGGLSVSADPGGSPFGYLPLAIFVPPLASGCNGDCDDGGYFFGVPAYTFNGATYTETLFSVNGTLEAGSASGVFSSFANQDLPDAVSPNNIMAPFWRDLNQSAGGEMYIAVLNGGGGTQWTVYEWEDVRHFGSADAVTMQVWIGNDGTPVAGDIHFVYDRMDNAAAGGTVGAENSAGTIGTNYFFNGTGTAPLVGDELRVETLTGGIATLGFQVTTKCKAKPTVNKGELANGANSEDAIAVTACP